MHTPDSQLLPDLFTESDFDPLDDPSLVAQLVEHAVVPDAIDLDDLDEFLLTADVDAEFMTFEEQHPAAVALEAGEMRWDGDLLVPAE